MYKSNIKKRRLLHWQWYDKGGEHVKNAILADIFANNASLYFDMLPKARKPQKGILLVPGTLKSFSPLPSPALWSKMTEKLFWKKRNYLN